MSLLSPQLVAFVEVSLKGTLLSASAGLGITQTGLTQRIQALEQNLGVALFLRSRTGMRLTPEGHTLLRYCQRVQELESETLAGLKGSNREVRLRLIAPSSLIRARLLPQTKELSEQFPRALFSYTISDGLSGIEELKRGLVDIAVVERALVPKEMDSKLIRSEDYVFVTHSDWKSRALQEIVDSERGIDFDEQDDYTSRYLKKFRVKTPEPWPRHFVNSTDALAQMLSHGFGYSVLAEDFLEHHFNHNFLCVVAPEQRLSISWALVWYPRNPMPTLFKKFIESVK
jgi:LysR family transcriptional regulator, chromosome initiation inhibitor